jgi:hypothetical protein
MSLLMVSAKAFGDNMFCALVDAVFCAREELMALGGFSFRRIAEAVFLPENVGALVQINTCGGGCLTGSREFTYLHLRLSCRYRSTLDLRPTLFYPEALCR